MQFREVENSRPLVCGKIEHGAEHRGANAATSIFASEFMLVNGSKLAWWSDEMISNKDEESFIPKGSEIYGVKRAVTETTTVVLSPLRDLFFLRRKLSNLGSRECSQ
jgi:hypothetical protein